jgi:tetratricopeptide (TPR) repeat protein
MHPMPVISTTNRLIRRPWILVALLAACICPAWAADSSDQDLPGDAIDLAVDMLWTITDVYFHGGQFDGAIKTEEMIVLLDSTQTDAYSSASWLYASAEKEKEAKDLLILETQQGIPAFEPFYEMGAWHYEHKEYSEAIDCFRKSIRFPAPPYVIRMLAHAYEKAGKLDDAIATWELIIRRDPKDGVAKTNLERVRKAKAGV